MDFIVLFSKLLTFFFFFSIWKSFQFQLNKSFSNKPVVLGSFQNRRSRNKVEIFHQYHNHQEFEFLNFCFYWVTCWPIYYAIFSTVWHNFHVGLEIHAEEIVFGT